MKHFIDFVTVTLFLACVLLFSFGCGPEPEVTTLRQQPLMKPGTWQCNWWEDPSPAHVLLIRTSGNNVCMGIGTNVSLIAAEGYTWPDGQFFGLHHVWFKARRSSAGQGVMSVLLGDDINGYNTVWDGPDHVKWHFDNNGWSAGGAGYFSSFGTNFVVRNVNNANW